MEVGSVRPPEGLCKLLRLHLGHHGGPSGTPGQPCRREDDSTIDVFAQGRTHSRQQSLFDMLHKASIRASTVAIRLLLQRRRVAQRAMRHTDRWDQAPRQWELPPGFYSKHPAFHCTKATGLHEELKHGGEHDVPARKQKQDPLGFWKASGWRQCWHS